MARSSNGLRSMNFTHEMRVRFPHGLLLPPSISINEMTWLKNDVIINDLISYAKNYPIIEILTYNEQEQEFHKEFPCFLYRNIKR